MSKLQRWKLVMSHNAMMWIKTVSGRWVKADEAEARIAELEKQVLVWLADSEKHAGDAMGAMARITELEAQVPRWISVDTALPEVQCDVVTLGGPLWKQVMMFTPAGHYDQKYSSFSRYIERSDSYVDCDNVTHWMPLPEPPKEGE